jgi:hypothetical protein
MRDTWTIHPHPLGDPWDTIKDENGLTVCEAGSETARQLLGDHERLMRLEAVAADLLAYKRQAFEEDSLIDLADLCTAFGAFRVRLKQALGLPLFGVERDYTPEHLAQTVAGDDAAEPDSEGAEHD